MEKSAGSSKVQTDKFWIWRINREEDQLIKDIDGNRHNLANCKRLEESIIKAEKTAALIKHRKKLKKTNFKEFRI